MKNELVAKQMRRDLDDRLRQGWNRVRHDVPKRGWIHNVREAIGFSTAQLGARLKISQSGVVALEQSEAAGTIQLKTLRKVAKALRCELVYALVPEEGTLENTLRERRRHVALRDLEQLMKESKFAEAERRALLTAYAEKIKLKRVWE
ncbi:MAG: transcriptional regulator [Alphaproteobacteria bacterium]|nr:transcriptional regulator [Alphaproteobacteria bacterium]